MVSTSLRCFVFHYLELGWGIFLGQMKLKCVSAPPLVFPCSPALCFKAFGAFFAKMRFSIGVNGGSRIKYFSFSGNRPSFLAMLTCLHFQALFLDILGPAKKIRKLDFFILVLSRLFSACLALRL